MARTVVLAVCILLWQAHAAFAQQHTCRFYAQNPDTITVTDAQSVEREVEVDFENTGTSTWHNTGGVSNLQYIELRPVGSNGLPIDGPLYHTTWINRQRVGSFLAIQQGVAPQQVARFVFKVQVNGQTLGVGTHDCYFRPYHAQGGYIYDWGNTRIRVVVTSASSPPPSQAPLASIQSISPSNPSAGTVVQFSGSASNNPLEYRWEANGQLFGSAVTVQQSFSAGSYAIRFLARNQYGWSAPATATLNVQPSAPPNPPGPTTMTSSIQSAVVERSVLRTAGGSSVESYDLIARGPIPLRRYHVLLAQGAVSGGTAVRHEWVLAQGGLSKTVGSAATVLTRPDDLYVGNQELRYRAQDSNGNWTSYASLPLIVQPWPQLFLPVHGIWIRSGNDYNAGDHVGSHLWAQDFNDPAGGHADFGLELVASLPGTVSVGELSGGGRYVEIVYEDQTSGQKLRAQYLHLSSVLVQHGQGVARGQPVGLCGNTGSASQGTHLHYALCEWVNGSWQSVAPEPYFLDAQTVKQTIAYNEVVSSNSRAVPSRLLVLPEQAVSAPYRDEFGYGHAKYWDYTTAGRQPTSSASWDFLAPSAGVWRLWMHNPSGVTNNNDGVPSHNTTTAAVFEVSRPRVLGLQTYAVSQYAGKKGCLLAVCDMDLQAGDRVQIRQHNATGESGKEISYDELLLTLEVPAGSGGNTPPSPPPPISQPNPSPSPVPPVPGPPPSPNPPANPGPSPSPSLPPNQPFGQGGGSGGGGGGCALTHQRGHPSTLFPFLLIAITLCAARRLRSLPS